MSNASCRTLSRLVESYLDGELEASQLLEVETHTETCATCRERVLLDRAIRLGVRKTVHAAEPTTHFRARAAASVMAQRWAAQAEHHGAASTMPTWAGSSPRSTSPSRPAARPSSG